MHYFALKYIKTYFQLQNVTKNKCQNVTDF